MTTQERARMRARRRGAAVSLIAASAVAAAPASAQAQNPAPASAATQPASATTTLSVSRDVLVGRRAWASGHDGSHQPGRPLVVEIRADGRWLAVAHTTTGAAGRFRVSWRPHDIGRFAVRVRSTGRRAVSAASAGRELTVYRAVEASWYGPGLYGGPLACGGTYDPGMPGVANKTLPCGTRVTLRYGGRSVTVAVIDRGPYVAGREYDLTAATRDRLHFPDTGTLWASR